MHVRFIVQNILSFTYDFNIVLTKKNPSRYGTDDFILDILILTGQNFLHCEYNECKKQLFITSLIF